ncbi:MAG TPA: SpoIIE family protein phosphatase [Solirubrobacteraceae bacterium]|nr:SpoIIE family protein phosphatase [Solirubrobacteraceae bacterium]
MPTDTDAFALLDALFANAPVGLGFWDAELRYRRVNAALAGMNGLAPDDHLGRTPSEVLGELGGDVERTIRAVLADRVARSDLPFDGETPAAPGAARHFRGSFYPVPDADGELLGVAAVVVEVTTERAAVRREETTSALLDAVFDAAPVGIAFWDLDLRYRRVNGALAAINGVDAADHLGRTPREVLGDELGGAVMGLMDAVVARGHAVLDEVLEGVLGDGRRQFRQTTVFPVVDAQGALAGLAGVVRDVTSQHDAEEERTRLLQEALAARASAEEARMRADVLARAGERLALVTRDYEATLQEVADFAVPALADRCAFTLVDARGVARKVAVAPASGPVPAGGLTVPDEVHEALRTGASLLTPRMMVVPLTTRGRTLGALRLERAASSPKTFSEDDLRTAQLFAVRAALSVENARLYLERSHIAQTLQRSLLPPALPDVPGLELAARYRAAGEQNEVGGDFYDAFRSGDGRWTVIIGDVSGKGAEAAALTSLTRHTLRAASLRTLDPIENLELLDEALQAQHDPAGRFSTVLYAQVRPDAHGAEVTMATGGHLPPIVLRAGGRVERIQLRGAIVGALRTPTFGERVVRLDHGDTLLLFTDGVVELRRTPRGGVRSGDEELEEVLASLRGATAAEIVEAVERHAVELQGGDPRDDIALVAIRPQA